MISQFLQFGYLGLLALLVVLCYRLIEGSNKSGRAFKETLVMLCVFSLVSLLGGGAGYLWASKELEVAKTKESTAVILKQQIAALREEHVKAMLPLQVALENSVKKMGEGVLSSTRQEHLQEINSINLVIQGREVQFVKSIDALVGVFEQTPQ